MSRLESLATLPKVLATAASSAAGAAATGAYELATAPEVHWMQKLVWVCTAFGGLAAGVLAMINAWTALHRYLANRRRRARYQRLKAEGKIPLP
jgi:hypothetical protein